MPLEIACFNLTSGVRALNAGADRIELCGSDCAGGSTPAAQDFCALLEHRSSSNHSNVPVHIMIRPRGGDFTYTDAEFDVMKATINTYIRLGADGFVFGILDDAGEIDKDRCSELVRLAGKPCTFHRAFDLILAKHAAILELIECGFSTVLTSGGEVDVVAGRQMLAGLVTSAQSRIEIMPGGGLRSHNLEMVRQEVSAAWWHSSADVYGTLTADEEEIINLKRALARSLINDSQSHHPDAS